MKPDPLLGTVIDNRYSISARIARGGMATVYHATDTRLERNVAVKVIHAHLAEQQDFVRRFISEARAAASLSSPHIVAVHDQGVAQLPSGELPYLVMELMTGPDLRSQLRDHGSFPLGMSLELVRQVLAGLVVAHHAGIIHRDIKPENVLLTVPLEPTALGPKFQAKLTDFGLARAASDATSTQTNSMLGTVGYVAPEFVSSGTTGKTSDIYSVGIMLYELIAGQLPFHGESAMNVAFKHVNETMPRLVDQAEWMPPAVDSLISLFTAKSASKRPQNAEAALDALTDIVASLPEEVLIRRIPVFPVAAEKRPQAPAATSVLPVSQTAVLDADQHGPVVPADSTSSVTSQPTTRAAASRNDTYAGVPKRRRRLWPLLTALLTLLIAGGSYGVWWYYSEGPGLRVGVPNVINLVQADAEAALTNAGLSFTVKEDFSDEVDKGYVVNADPTVGAKIHPSMPVTLIVSAGIEHIIVPDVAGKAKDEALTVIQDSRLKAEVAEAYSDTVPAGKVISQKPEAAASIPHTTPVTLTISLGREPVSTPDLTNATIEDATARLTEAGLEAKVTEEFSDTVPAGVVISQESAPGTTLYRGDSLPIKVSKGPELIKVPNVFGLQEAAATKALKDAGFNVDYHRILGGYFGTVRSQNPGAGEMVKPGSTITLTIV
ncbi:Stk1 family PASTA domain-containing Ser/Thr kinase [Trueperella pecoris]|uniref:non-specific serine/threonine protein kinase n=1 Tax=Trueperella pecoris TaxID=2733571 RepID=A0A7M1QWY2_9ACTO|nr:Stk1 family PASTA domain-containing Ser/Thr kinase [Trueperella pecoris]QOR46448.1 Stk1 family PASTA domain-containing Ser/Thr kinase [Trueperella pecoris]